MSLIREVKERVDIVKVVEFYGLKLNRAYKCVCPFHKEKQVVILGKWENKQTIEKLKTHRFYAVFTDCRRHLIHNLTLVTAKRNSYFKFIAHKIPPYHTAAVVSVVVEVSDVSVVSVAVAVVVVVVIDSSYCGISSSPSRSFIYSSRDNAPSEL